jgi:glycosyltransferase involved in cell wall biosynthesis
MTPVFSIIIPVYNVEEYLPYCLRSVREQTFEDIEIICVDDGSTDASADILLKSASCDSRVRIIYKKNGGLSSARNVGIKHAQGDYIMFVDSDDTIEKSTCQRVIDACHATGAEIVTFGGSIFPPGVDEYWVRCSLSPRSIFYDSFHIDIIMKEQSKPFVWRTALSNTLLRRSGLLFDETVKFGEDMLFLFMAYPRALSTVFICDKLYHYRYMRENSLMSLRNSDITAKIVEHFTIIERVTYDWRLSGLLEQYPVDLLKWAFHFVLYEIVKLNASLQFELLVVFKRTLLACFSGISFIDHNDIDETTRELYASLMGITKDIDSINHFNESFQDFIKMNLNIDEEYTSIPQKRYRTLRDILRKILPQRAVNAFHNIEKLNLLGKYSLYSKNPIIQLNSEYQRHFDSGTLLPVTIHNE